MTYLDSSVALAHLLGETRRPPPTLWEGPIVSSRLLAYEVWNRVNARGLAPSHGEVVRLFLGRLAFLALSSPVLARALEPFPEPVRTLDALHLASAAYLAEQGHEIRLATYDDRLGRVARGLGLAAFEP